MTVPTLLTLATMFSRRYADYPSHFPNVHRGVDSAVYQDLQKPFDFIIVGSGYAGSFLAAQLSRYTCMRVLLIEAGGVPTFDAAIPFARIHDRDKTEWQYYSTPQKRAAQAMKDQKVRLSMGKALGGNAVVDSGIYSPPNLADFHRWSFLYQLDGWGYVEMKPFIFRLESGEEQPGPDDDPDHVRTPRAKTSGSRAHDKRLQDMPEGEILEKIHNIHRGADPMDPLKAAWLKSGAYLNTSHVDSEEQDMYYRGGFFLPKTMIHKGMKLNPAAQFLQEANDNLIIVSHAEVDGLLYTPDGRRVVGLTFRDTLNNATYHVNCVRDVILSAGPIGSAQILLQSGIGPADMLRSQNIPVLLDLPVGSHLNDRVSVPIYVKVNRRFIDSIREQLNDPDEFMAFLESGRGILANSSVVGCALIRSGFVRAPDLLMELKPVGLLTEDAFMTENNYKEDVLSRIDANNGFANDGGFVITLTLLRPFSQGTMWLWRRHDDTFVPRMNPSYLADQRDIDSLVNGIRQVEQLMSTEYFAAMETRLAYPQFEGCPPPLLPSTDEYWACYLRQLATSGGQLASTAPLGSVVDDHLRVKGVSGLRVIDQAIFPEPASGGVASTILAVANRGFRHIRNDNRLRC